ncbi:MAG: chromate transporter [Dokdonella sp.]|nr:MAG: chromate transporter [Dokdonella sp.]
MHDPAKEATPGSEAMPTYSLWQLVAYMLKLGAIGFGGPVALVGYMHSDLVERRRWISDADYDEGMTLSQLAPGPLATQLAIYIGYVHYGVLGATLAGVAFVVPSFLMVLGISMAYVEFGGLVWMQSVFYGVGAAVIGIIALSARKLTQKVIGKDRLLWLIYLVLAIVTIVTGTEYVALVLGAGVLVWLVRAPPGSKPGGGALAGLVGAPALATASSLGTLGQIALFFSKAGAFVFGSGLAIIPFLYGRVVLEHRCLTEAQFTDAVAVAMITPGPVVITVAFIGYLVAGFPGAFVSAVATFLPCYLFTIVPAPYMKKHGKAPAIAAFVKGVTAAAIGAIAGAVVVLAKNAIHDLPTALMAIAAALLLYRFKKLPEPAVILGAAALGLAIYPLMR